MGGLVGGLLEPARDVALERDRLADLVRSSASRSLASASRISRSISLISRFFFTCFLLVCVAMRQYVCRTIESWLRCSHLLRIPGAYRSGSYIHSGILA